MNARQARLSDEAGSFPVTIVFSRQEKVATNRCLALFERQVPVQQSRHYRRGVEINSTRDRVRFLFNADRRLVNDLHYDLQDFSAEFDSLLQHLTTLHGILSDFARAVDTTATSMPLIICVLDAMCTSILSSRVARLGLPKNVIFLFSCARTGPGPMFPQ